MNEQHKLTRPIHPKHLHKIVTSRGPVLKEPAVQKQASDGK